MDALAQCSHFALVHLLARNLRALRSRCPEAPVTALGNLSEFLVEVDRRGIRVTSLLKMMDDAISANNSGAGRTGMMSGPRLQIPDTGSFSVVSTLKR